MKADRQRHYERKTGRQRNSESEIGHIKRQTERLRGRYILERNNERVR